MSSIKEKVLGLYIKNLADEGEKIIVKASAINDTTPRSFNMQDAYGCAVYYNNRIVAKRYVNPAPKSGEIHKGWVKHGIEPNTGRGYLEDFLNSYRPPSNGIVMICVNVIYYTSILENGAQANGRGTPNGSSAPSLSPARKYRIISEMSIDFARLSNKYKGSKALKITL